jgi:hypothetical protein
MENKYLNASPIYSDDYALTITKPAFYVDKTLLIEELFKPDPKTDQQIQVSVITRPRRFGKSLNLSMLENFFDINKDSTSLF